MKTALAIRHIHFEDLGTLEPLLRQRGYQVQYVDATVDDLSSIDVISPDLLVLLGGPIGAYDEEFYPFILDELNLVHRRLTCGRPLLGICLGAQLIARALGGKVYALDVKEIGFGPLTLTEEGRASALASLDDVQVLHWHGDQFDIPPGAVRLAGTAVCANQAFAVGAQILGLQFHLEVDARVIDRWLVGHACELQNAGIDPRTLRSTAQASWMRISGISEEVFLRWLDHTDTVVKEQTTLKRQYSPPAARAPQ